ncbi:MULTISPECIES: cysteine hydrolase family protein [unclassified Pseudomonas]|uniref:cysteine hydrolase family protein n=1 Tax=unclassified Pseudomonas TaxID=196821 RepID=UPI0025F71F5F|nr:MULTISPECIES: cysteine hydrolase family protein [unclassified Pseudomonas]
MSVPNTDPKTMFQLSNREYAAATLSNATLIIIDAQKEYLSGPLALTGVQEAIDNIVKLVDAARLAKSPIIHVRHLGTVGGMFDPQGERGKFVPELLPLTDEIIIEKTLPNAMKGTVSTDKSQEMHMLLEKLGRLDLVVCGFMSHSSVSTTVRAAKDYGFRCTLVEDACATRDLPIPTGVIKAERVQQAEMAIMNDNFAKLALTKDLI